MTNFLQTVKARYIINPFTSIVVLHNFCGKGYRVAIIDDKQIHAETYLEIIEGKNGWTTYHPNRPAFCGLELYRDWSFQPCSLKDYLEIY